MRRFTLKQLFATITVAAVGLAIACSKPPLPPHHMTTLGWMTGLPLVGAAIGSLFREPITCAIVGAFLGFLAQGCLYQYYVFTYGK